MGSFTHLTVGRAEREDKGKRGAIEGGRRAAFARLWPGALTFRGSVWRGGEAQTNDGSPTPIGARRRPQEKPDRIWGAGRQTGHNSNEMNYSE